MPNARRCMALALVLCLAGCAAMTGGRTKHVRQVEEMLVAAGFHAAPADTPDKKARLDRMSPRRQLSISQRAGKPYYWYADPKGCGCLFVGDEVAYQRFANLRVQEDIAESERATARMEENAAEVDAQMDGYYDPYRGPWFMAPAWTWP